MATNLKIAAIIKSNLAYCRGLLPVLLTFSKYTSKCRICPKCYPSTTIPKYMLIKMWKKRGKNLGKQGTGIPNPT